MPHCTSDLHIYPRPKTSLKCRIMDIEMMNINCTHQLGSIIQNKHSKYSYLKTKDSRMRRPLFYLIPWDISIQRKTKSRRNFELISAVHFGWKRWSQFTSKRPETLECGILIWYESNCSTHTSFGFILSLYDWKQN